MISAVIVTLNEGKKLRGCLESIESFVQEIVIVDLGSSDGTLDFLAKYRKVRVFKHPRVDYVEVVRNFAINKCSGEWVLVMDPDERITPGLIKKLKEVEQSQYVAVNIPRKNVFFGNWISHSNFWPDRHIRFFKKLAVYWPVRIHTYPEVKGKMLTLDAREDWAIVHYGYDSFADFIDRQKRYALVEARNRLEEGKRFSLLDLIWQPIREFLVRFIKHLGFLDGLNGVFLVLALMYYRIDVEIKMLKLAKK